MLARLASLRLRLLGALLASALVGLVASYFAIAHILRSSEQASDRRQTERTAQTIAARLRVDVDTAFLRTAQALLHSMQLEVYRHDRLLFAGPSLTGVPLETTASRPFPGGRVVVRKYELSPSVNTLELTLVAGAASGLVILTALAITALLTRTVRGPIERAIAAADQVASGDLSARMGGGGPDEFDRLSRAFDGMAERLEHHDHEQRRFLADIAHEIATPVNALTNLAAALADGTAGTAERAETVMLLREESARVEALLDDLRQLTRLDLAEPARFEPVALHELCHGLARRFQGAVEQAGLRLEVEAAPLTATSNRRLLEAILANLLSNAIRYTPPGGRIRLHLHRRRGRPAISVSDTGIGIAPEHQQRIFDRLYRVDSDRGRQSGGSGLGLAIVRRASHALGATISLQSQPGTGSTFTLQLPRPERAPNETSPVPKQAGTSSQTGRT